MSVRRPHKQCYSFDANLDDIQKCVEEHHRVLVLMRGVTGSGKSTVAQKLVTYTDNFKIFTADDSSQITKLVRSSIDEEVHLVIVDDDNIDRIHVKKLMEIGISNMYECFVLEPQTEWQYNSEECSRHSSRECQINTIEMQIHEILESPITWDYLLPGGDKNVEVNNFHVGVFTEVSTHSSSSSSSSDTVPQPSPTQPFFSMKPTPLMKVTRSVGTLVHVENIAYSMADMDDRVNNFCQPEESKHTPAVYRGKVCMLDRSMQFPEKKDAMPLFVGTSEELEFSMLRSIFWQTDMLTIRHQLLIRGYEKAFQVLDVLNEIQTTGILPIDDRIMLEEAAIEESSTSYHQTLAEEMECRQEDRDAVHFIEGPYLDTSSDEQIAHLLEADSNESDLSDNRPYNHIDRKNLAHLQRMFPTCEAETIRNTFELSNKEVNATRDNLIFMGMEEIYIPQPKTWSNIASSPSSKSLSQEYQKTEKEKSNHFLNLSEYQDGLLKKAQQFAIQTRKKLEEDRIRLRGNAQHSAVHGSTVFMEQSKSFNDQLWKRIAEIDQKLREGHQNPFFIDLHYMSVNGAISLVKESIEAARYYKRIKRHIKSITVVTGSGNNSRDGARIKPELEKELQRMGMRFSKVNDGCLEVKV